MPSRDAVLLRVRRRGSATVEFALVGIPTIFMLISIFEISRGMWLYETVAHAVREGARYAAVHGEDCANIPNTCGKTLGEIAQQIQNAGVGLEPSQFMVTISVNLGATNTVLTTIGPTTLANMVANTTSFSGWTFVSSGTNVQASGPGNDVVVSGEMPFYSAIAMFWPGAAGAKTIGFATTKLVATSQERILF